MSEMEASACSVGASSGERQDPDPHQKEIQSELNKKRQNGMMKTKMDSVGKTPSSEASGSGLNSNLRTYGNSKRSRDYKNCHCCNENCDSKCQDFTPAPSHAITYFGLQNSKRKNHKICSKCLERTDSFLKNSIDALKNRQPLFKYKIEPRTVVTIDLFDEDEISDEDSEEEAERERRANEIVEIRTNNLGKLVDEITEQFHLSYQVKSCTSILEQEMKDLDESFQDLDSRLNLTQNLIEQTRKLHISLTSPANRSVVLNHVDIDANGKLKYFPGENYDLSLPPVASPGTTNKNVLRRSQSRFLPKPVQQPTPTTPTKTTLAKSPNFRVDPEEVLEIDSVRQPIEERRNLHPTPKVIPRQKPQLGDKVYAMHRTCLHFWLRGVVVGFTPHSSATQGEFLIKFEPTKNVRPSSKLYSNEGPHTVKAMTAKQLAYNLPCPFVLPVSTRVIAKYIDEFSTGNKIGQYYAGIVGEPPKYTNNYRYLILFDGGRAQYVGQEEVLLVVESAKDVWLDVHADSADFIRNYVVKYPERPMVRLQKGSVVNTEWNSKWYIARVEEVDCSLVKMHFEADNRYEWIYRGSTRLSPLFHKQKRQMNATSTIRRHNVATASRKYNQPAIEYLYGDDEDYEKILESGIKQVARKSTSLPQWSNSPMKAPIPTPLVGVKRKNNSHVRNHCMIEYEGRMQRLQIPDNFPKPKVFLEHKCNRGCVREYNKNDKILKGINPLALPFYLGWSREIGRGQQQQQRGSGGGVGGGNAVYYRTPCGRRLRNYEELYKFLRVTMYDLSIDYFCYDLGVDCLNEFTPTRVLHKLKDLTYGKEPIPIACVNSLDYDNPEYIEYSSDRVAGEGVNLNLDNENFVSCCDCVDDCKDRMKCACFQLTMSGISFTKLNSVENPTKTYENRRLYSHIVSGVYECNSRCRCRQTCFNRVAQNKVKWPLQVFKTSSKGWGIRPLYDIPKGAFICVYAGQLLTEQGANESGTCLGDEYLAELDFIEVNEDVKADYESDVVEDEEDDEHHRQPSKKMSKRNSSESEAGGDESDKEFVMKVGPCSGRTINTRRKTEGGKTLKAKIHKDFVVGGDDEEEEEEDGFDGLNRGKFSANPDTGLNKSKRLPTRELFGRDEQCFIMDAKTKGNIGRYLNHSCNPNVFVQNVFVDTHDLRFPWVAFFANNHIRAGTELTWDYNYDIGSVPSKRMFCYCGAPECRGRLL